LLKLNGDFPRFRICFEDCTTSAALDGVRIFGPVIIGSGSSHWPSLAIDNVVGNALNYCEKLIAKEPHDRDALLVAAAAGSPEFSFGSDAFHHSIGAECGGVDGKASRPLIISVRLMPHLYFLTLSKKAACGVSCRPTS